MELLQNDLLCHFVSGTLAGLVSTTVFHPLDLIKVRMQVHRGAGNAYEGVLSGLTPAVLAASISWGGYFYLYEKSKSRRLGAYAPQSRLQGYDHLLAGIEAGCVMVAVTNPLWLVKTRLQLQGRSALRYAGLGDAVRTVLREEGVLGFYKGVVPALLLTSHGAVQFAVYEQLKVHSEALLSQETRPSLLSTTALTTVISSLAKVVASVVTYPYQVVKSRMQQRGAAYESSAARALSGLSGTVQCVSSVYRADGVRGFYRGLVPNIIRVVPSAAVTFVVYEETMRSLRSLRATS